MKVGDFGLSISTLARDETHLTATGTILGTPAFASPEQLEGQELDVRSDIYYVGATLYYLLTGRAPFEEGGAVKLIARILKEPPQSPSSLRPDIPKRLAATVLRCLAKERSERFGSYAELRRELFPFSSSSPIAADLRTRILAGIIDQIILGLHQLFYGAYIGAGGSYKFHPDRATATLLGAAIQVLYYGLLEGIWGASIGKTICGIRVVGPDKNVPGLPKRSCALRFSFQSPLFSRL